MTDDHGHRFAVYSATGMHIGLWNDGITAAKVLEEYPGGCVEELVTLDYARALVAAALKPWVDVACESHGLAGFHLNGDIAGWDELDMPSVPEDAKKALADLLKAEREKALREAADAVEGARCNPWATNVILALIEEKEPGHE